MRPNQPEWLKEALFYEIYPQSFKDTNGDGIGDIEGIIEKLDYIQGLGCNAIWMNPCFVSPFKDAGYDISDYYNVAPRYGTNDDLKRLFAEAHKRGMHVLLDLVPGHTSTEHPWFAESCKAARNEYTDRYAWTDSVWKAPEDYSCIRGISERDGACIVNFFSHQPALNYGFYDRKEAWQQSQDDEGPQATLEEMKNVMRFWLDMGCDGYRVDMASSLVKNDPDSAGTIRLWQTVREFMDKEYPQAAMVSEWGQADKALEAGYHMDFLLHFGTSHYNDLFRCEEPFFSSRGKGSAHEFVNNYTNNLAKTDGKGMICFPCGNHDMERLKKYLNEDEIKLVFAFILTMPGAPFIYYGDEIGMRYLEGIPSVEGGYFRTGSRSPMQWDSSENAGFSNAQPEKLYVRLDADTDRPTVEKQLADPGSLLNEVKRLISIRKENPALGNLSSVEFINDTYPLAYRRSCEEQTLTVVINPSGERKELKNIVGRVLYTMGNGGEIKDDTCYIEGMGGLILAQ